MPPPLLAGQHEQLSVNGKQLGDGVLEAAAGSDSRADSVDPRGGNGFDVLLAVDHEGEGVERMSSPLGAMAAWFATPSMSQHQRPGQSVGGDAKTGQQRAFATFQRGGVGSDGRYWQR